MDLKFAKALGAELASKLPWQEIADSPTVRYYTEWSKFEGYKPLEVPAPLPGEAGPCKIVLVDGALAAVGRCSGVEVGAAADVFHNVQINSKILALHASALRAAVRITITGQVEPLVVVMSASAKGAHTASHVAACDFGNYLQRLFFP